RVAEGIRTSAGAPGEPHVALAPPTRPGGCPACGKAMAPDAVLCVECGFDRRTGRRRETRVRRLDQSWRTRLPPVVRVASVVFAVPGFLVLALLIFRGLDLQPAWYVLPFLASVLIAVYLLGTERVVRLTRTKRGRLELIRYSYVAFLPAGEQVIDLRGYL